jgi:hypothetical protein
LLPVLVLLLRLHPDILLSSEASCLREGPFATKPELAKACRGALAAPGFRGVRGVAPSRDATIWPVIVAVGALWCHTPYWPCPGGRCCRLQPTFGIVMDRVGCEPAR